MSTWVQSEEPANMLNPFSPRLASLKDTVTFSPWRMLPEREHRLPMFPLWPGFALDTAFYGTLAFLLWSAPGFVRKKRRRRRGLCVGCGYELKGMEKCPECGRAVTK
jgi:hypothetical protein